MADFIDFLNNSLDWINGYLWHEYVLYFVMGVGVLFTLWSGFCQYRALTHGTAVVRGKYDDKNDPGAISHFQALSAALSATVGIGNIGGVAVAVSLGGPGAIFWMWMVGLVGMALKTTEVTLSMLYRNTDNPDEPHGGPMWVADKGFAKWGPGWGVVGKWVAGIFCVTLLIATITGGNMFQAWNVAEVSAKNLGVERWVAGLILAVLCGLVIIGGIKRIGQVAGTLVPLMCLIYLVAAVIVLVVKWAEIPHYFGMIFEYAFNPIENQNAFIGGTAGYAFLWGMKRALFSNEAGQGSSPIAHSAARTDEPVREGVVAGLEPFIDTLVVCTLTSLVILSTGVWEREPVLPVDASTIEFREAGSKQWMIASVDPETTKFGSVRLKAEPSLDWGPEDSFFVVVKAHKNGETDHAYHRVAGNLVKDGGSLVFIQKDNFESNVKPVLGQPGVFEDHRAAALTSYAFDSVLPGWGGSMVTIAVWLFALSTVISWSYYGEQGMVYLFGERSIFLYRVVYCLFIFVTCLGFITTERELDNITALGTGVMLVANLPICLIFGRQTMSAYHGYMRRLKKGEME